MRIQELTEATEKPQYSPEFWEAVDSWQSMWQPAKNARIILASPEAKPFMKAPSVKHIFRAVRSLDPSKSPVIAYSTSIVGAEQFAKSLEVSGKWVVVQKKFSPADFLLDFTSMIEYYKIGLGYGYRKEHEIWMRNTPYYASPDQDEVVDMFRT